MEAFSGCLAEVEDLSADRIPSEGGDDGELENTSDFTRAVSVPLPHHEQSEVLGCAEAGEVLVQSLGPTTGTRHGRHGAASGQQDDVSLPQKRHGCADHAQPAGVDDYVCADALHSLQCCSKGRPN